MKSTIMIAFFVTSALVVYGSPLSIRPASGTVVIRQSAHIGDAIVDTIVNVDSQADKTFHPLKGMCGRNGEAFI